MSDQTERNQFLAALLRNEDDIPTRMAYADWLDEIGEHEEADRQRRWPAAKQWIKDLCDAYRPTEEYRKKLGDDAFDYRMETYIPYERLIERAFDAVTDEEDTKEGWLFIGLGASDSLCDDLRDHSALFWENWSIITGIPIATNRIKNASYSCAC